MHIHTNIYLIQNYENKIKKKFFYLFLYIKFFVDKYGNQKKWAFFKDKYSLILRHEVDKVSVQDLTVEFHIGKTQVYNIIKDKINIKLAYEESERNSTPKHNYNHHRFSNI